MKLTKKQIKEFYDNWDSYPDGKINLKDDDLRECVWCKELPGGFKGINNNPITSGHHWQDILYMGKVVHRKWEGKLPFFYPPAQTEKEDIERRKILNESLNKFGEVWFFYSGMGYIWVEKKLPEIPKQVSEVLKEIPFIKNNVVDNKLLLEQT